MEKKEIKKSISEELSKEELDLVAGGYQSFSTTDDPNEIPVGQSDNIPICVPYQTTPPWEVDR